MLTLTKATLEDWPIIQKMIPFFIYELARYWDWPFEENGKGLEIAYEHSAVFANMRRYIDEDHKTFYLIKNNQELAGLACIRKEPKESQADWYLGEFFILSRFQGKGTAQEAIKQLWSMHKGQWHLNVLPINTRGLRFWEKTIDLFTQGKFSKELTPVVEYCSEPRITFRFRV